MKGNWPKYYTTEEEKRLSDEIHALNDYEFRKRFEKAYQSGEVYLDRGDDTSFKGFMDKVVFEEGPRFEVFDKNFFGVTAKEAQTRRLNSQELEWKVLIRDLIRRWHAVSQFTHEDVAEIMANLKQISETITASGNQVNIFSIDHWRRYAYILQDSPNYIKGVEGKELPWTFRELLIDLNLVSIDMSPEIPLSEIGRRHLEQLIQNLRAVRRLYEKLDHHSPADQSVKLLLDGRVIIEPRLIKRWFGYWDPNGFMVRMARLEEYPDKDASLVPVTWEQIVDRDFRLPKPQVKKTPRYDFMEFTAKVEGFIATRDAQGILELLGTEFSDPDYSEHDAQGRALLENVRAILGQPKFGYAHGTMRDIVKGGEKERRAVYILKRLHERGNYFAGALKHQQLTVYGQVYSELIRMLGRETILDNPELLSLFPKHIVAVQLHSDSRIDYRGPRGDSGGYLNKLIYDATQAFNEGRYEEARDKAREALDWFIKLEKAQNEKARQAILDELDNRGIGASDFNYYESDKAAEILAKAEAALSKTAASPPGQEQSVRQTGAAAEQSAKGVPLGNVPNFHLKGNKKTSDPKNLSIKDRAPGDTWMIGNRHVHISDSHNECGDWLTNGIIRKGATLLLFDFHSDLHRAYMYMNEGTWIIPLLESGVISRVVWVIPPWVKDLDNSDMQLVEEDKEVVDILRKRPRYKGVFCEELPPFNVSYCDIEDITNITGDVVVSFDYDFFSANDRFGSNPYWNLHKASRQEIQKSIEIIFKTLLAKNIDTVAFDLCRGGRVPGLYQKTINYIDCHYAYADQTEIIEKALLFKIERRPPRAQQPAQGKAELTQRKPETPPSGMGGTASKYSTGHGSDWNTNRGDEFEKRSTAAEKGEAILDKALASLPPDWSTRTIKYRNSFIEELKGIIDADKLIAGSTMLFSEGATFKEGLWPFLERLAASKLNNRRIAVIAVKGAERAFIERLNQGKSENQKITPFDSIRQAWEARPGRPIYYFKVDSDPLPDYENPDIIVRDITHLVRKIIAIINKYCRLVDAASLDAIHDAAKEAGQGI